MLLELFKLSDKWPRYQTLPAILYLKWTSGVSYTCLYGNINHEYVWLQIVGESFHGCVDFVSFSSSISQETITFNLTSPTTSVGTRSCYKDVQTGVYLQQNSYIHVGKMYVHPWVISW